LETDHATNELCLQRVPYMPGTMT